MKTDQSKTGKKETLRNLIYVSLNVLIPFPNERKQTYSISTYNIHIIKCNCFQENAIISVVLKIIFKFAASLCISALAAEVQWQQLA